MRGRPPVPTEEKRRRGTLRADRHPIPTTTIEPLSAQAPAQSTADALEAVLGAGAHWLAATDAIAVSLLRDAVEDYAKLRRRRKGVTPKDVRDAGERVARLLSQLGFDPTARARLGLAEVKAISKLEELRARRDA